MQDLMYSILLLYYVQILYKMQSTNPYVFRKDFNKYKVQLFSPRKLIEIFNIIHK